MTGESKMDLWLQKKKLVFELVANLEGNYRELNAVLEDIRKKKLFQFEGFASVDEFLSVNNLPTRKEIQTTASALRTQREHRRIQRFIRVVPELQTLKRKKDVLGVIKNLPSEN